MNNAEDQIPIPGLPVFTEEESSRQVHADLSRTYITEIKMLRDANTQLITSEQSIRNEANQLRSKVGQLEKELKEANDKFSKSSAGFFGRLAAKATTERNQLTSRLEASERANSEMREALKPCVPFLTDYLRHNTHAGVSRLLGGIQDALSSTSGQSYIPREVGEKMYEALKMVDMQHPFMFVTLAKALQLAQKHGLGKEKE